MPDVTINGIVINFPFKPYKVQEDYMEKVIECLRNGKHGVLESPTGTGKTLSLLCSSLSWLLEKKVQIQLQDKVGMIEKSGLSGQYVSELFNGINKAVGVPNQSNSFGLGWAIPKIVYASRTHSQLSQAMQELKRTSYSHVKVAVLGSRDQLCIHPEVSKEPNSFNKIYMCQAKVKARTCFYYNNVENRKDDPIFKQKILDIEDLVTTGQKMKCCPYFLSKELKQDADITFMPYNYLLDPKMRKAQGIELQNNVVLLDEAHNVEKMCEESASLEISSTDVAICIDEISTVMQDVANEITQNDFALEGCNNALKDFSQEDLCFLKILFLDFEKAIDSIVIKNRSEGETFPGGYIFELLEKANLTYGNEQLVIDRLEKIILYLSTTSTSPFARKGNGLQKFCDLLRIVFNNSTVALRHREKVKRCYKVHVQIDELKKGHKSDGWEVKKVSTKNEGKIISYWCFSSGFGMQQLLEQGVRSIILTSGTLSPLKPLISELGIPIDVQLENPHIITGRQICIGVLSQGPDSHPLNSSFNTRNDPKYIASLGRTVYNFSCLIPNGMLVFFPSYPIMKKCREDWQNSGIWTKIADRKPIYVEPQSKSGFTNIMNEYYQKIQDPLHKGAIFMAVCRGKVSEGLDFADANGRAVLITGLPFPPLKDPRIILKQRYLEENRSHDKEALTGQQWYQLEAFRAVNQAVGRIIRHQNDYGAIILCDCRFNNPNFKKHLSAWLQPHLKNFTNFGIITRDLREFFRCAEQTLPRSSVKCVTSENNELSLPAVPARFDTSSSRTLSTSSKLNTVVSPESESNFNIKAYVVETSTHKPNTEDNKKNFFELLESKSKTMINFSNCKLEGNWNRCELTKDISAPVLKKRKIKMLPVECNTNICAPSTSTAPPATSNLENTENITNENQSIAPKIITDDRRELGKMYLKDVKRSLTEDKFKVFTKMTQDYRKNGDFNELVQTLKILFSTNENSRLFKGFGNFLKKEHVSSFDSHIKILEL